MREYPLLDWIRDILDWCTLCDYHPPQQGIAIKNQLQGSAVLMAESYTHDQLIAGINDPATGTNVDAVTMIINGLVR